MNVELPTTGCNIINSATSFYNYSTDGKTRESYVIYEGKALLQNSTYNQYGYTYTGTCLHTGDLVFKPEFRVIFPVLSFIITFAITYVIIHIILGRFLK